MEPDTRDETRQWPRVAVAWDVFARGVAAPGLRNKHGQSTYDWREPPGSLGNAARVTASYEVMSLADALERVFDTDAHVTLGVLHGPDGEPFARQPRLTKSALPWLREQGYEVRFDVMGVDIDNPHAPGTTTKRPWDEELLTRAHDWIATADVFRDAAHYFTSSGMRAFQPLATPLDPEAYERALVAYLARFMRASIEPDLGCKDWTRQFRLPNVLRKGKKPGEKPFEVRCVAVGWARAIEAVVPAARDVVAATPRRKTPRVTSDAPAFDAAVPPTWTDRVAILAAAIRQDEVDSYHALSLALAGALCRVQRVPLEFVPAIVAGALLGGGAQSGEHAATNARDTVQRFCAGIAVTGRRHLHRSWPAVGMALEEILARGGERALFEQAKTVAPGPRVTADEASEAQENFIRFARQGVNLASASPGIGKSRAARIVAAERSRIALGPGGILRKRIPHSKTGLTTPTHALAIEYAAEFKVTYDVPVQRLLSPVAFRNGDGTPVCRFHETASALLEGGLSIQQELCEGRQRHPCEYSAGCTARHGTDGVEGARITLGPHAFVGRIATEVGSTGMLIIDEPPPLILTVRLTPAELTAALEYTGLTSRYTAALRPALIALRAHAADPATSGAMMRLEAVLGARAEHVPPVDLHAAADATRLPRGADGDAIVAYARGAFADDVAITTPPVRYTEIARSKVNPAYAKHVAAMARVYNAVYAALTTTFPPAVWLDTFRDRRDVVLKFTNEPFVTALRRDGVTVLLDADMHLQRDAIARVVGATVLPEVTFDACDGAPIHRTLFRMTRANRTAWWKDGYPDWSQGVHRGLTHAFAWLNQVGAKRAGLVSFLPVEMALRAIVDPERGAYDWEMAGHSAAELDAAKKALGPLVATWDGALYLGHYGAMRGLNRFERADLDAFVTVGDPWPDVGDVARDCEFLGFDVHSNQRAEALCKAELRQAHGRMREPRRTREAWLLHVGGMMPGGSGWGVGKVEMQMDHGGPLAPDGKDLSAEFRAVVKDSKMPIEALAKFLGCSRSSLDRFMSGERTVSQDLIDRIRDITPQEEG